MNKPMAELRLQHPVAGTRCAAERWSGYFGNLLIFYRFTPLYGRIDHPSTSPYLIRFDDTCTHTDGCSRIMMGFP